MHDGRSTVDPLSTLAPVADAATVRDLVAAVARLFVSPAIQQYVVALVEATRSSPDLRLGASPRAGLQLLRAARASAALNGRDHVLPDDVQALAGPVLAHRLLLGERPLVQMSVFALALPVLSSAAVARERFRLTARRVVTPPRVPRGA